MSYFDAMQAAFTETFGDNTANIGEKLKSELPNVSDEAWTYFVQSMISAPLHAVSKSNELGMFKFKPRRLADLGLVNNLTRIQAPSGRTVWAGTFLAPMTSRKFLKSPKAQYAVFVESMQDYINQINVGKIEKDQDMSIAGALAILHKAGPKGLETWKKGEIFPETKRMYDSVAGVF